jgi:hypothetical protein
MVKFGVFIVNFEKNENKMSKGVLRGIFRGFKCVFLVFEAILHRKSGKFDRKQRFLRVKFPKSCFFIVKFFSLFSPNTILIVKKPMAYKKDI